MIHSVSLMHFDLTLRLGISADMLCFASVCDKGRMGCNSGQYKRLGLTIWHLLVQTCCSLPVSAIKDEWDVILYSTKDWG